jgi:hypothetical protein
MPIIGATDIVVHLTGLILLTANMQGPGVQAIVPRVVYVDPWAAAVVNQQSYARADYKLEPATPEPPTPQPPAPQLQEMKPQAAPAQPSAAPPPHQHPAAAAPSLATRFSLQRVQPHVEDHVALLLIPEENYDSNINWEPQKDSASKPTYRFVRLDKERISFKTDVTSNPASLQNVGLPKLQTECCADMELDLKRYGPPSYPAAAAVVDITQGDVKTCTAYGLEGSRLDTEISALRSNNGFLTIIGSANKELRLKSNSAGKITVFVANVPASYLNNQFTPKPETALDGMSHYHAYYSMGGAKAAGCTKTLKDWLKDHHYYPPSCSVGRYPKVLGTQSVMSAPIAKGPSGGADPQKSVSFNFECSNTQWP